ncbi:MULTISPECIES: LuxR C-terminal-related transcriptional regulator [unclassified Pseudomonas]|uniref:helix-turn-helix transcriptional regulator n=1 Tax=unclassified Pseudomonas TaxID=196821 RepID=UPI00245766D7|nr:MULTISPECIES: LuxR C-terminal-related transcriptional regulator [unclassified Pseudomonas]
MKDRLMSFFRDICQAATYSVYERIETGFSHVESYSLNQQENPTRHAEIYATRFWENDPFHREMMTKSRQSRTGAMKIDYQRLPEGELRNIYAQALGEVALIYGASQGSTFVISLVRPFQHGGYSETQLEALRSISPLVITILAKHYELIPKLEILRTPWKLSDIQQRLKKYAINLPQRELEVCARTLYGMSSTGIALDLNIGEESVRTYRKRAYARLRIGSAYELLGYYLNLFSPQPSHLTRNN